MGLREDQMEYSRRVFTGQTSIADSAFGMKGPLDTFATSGVDVFSFWFYSPTAHEYRLVYWLAEEQPYPALITLSVEHPRLKPFIDYLQPLASRQLLQLKAVKPQTFNAENITWLSFLDLDTVPSVVSFKASESPAVARAPQRQPLNQHAGTEPVPAFRR